MHDHAIPTLIRAAAFVVAAALLTGCTTSGSSDEQIGRTLVAPGKYEFHDCAQLAKDAETYTKRIKELAALTAKAKQGPAGGLVSALSYDTEYYAARAEMVELRKAQAAKNCPPPPPPRRR